MDIRAEKIAKARQKLKDHQDKKIIDVRKEQSSNKSSVTSEEILNNTVSSKTDSWIVFNPDNVEINKTEPPKEANAEINFEKKSDVNITEILISTKTDLESQITHLTEKLTHLEGLYSTESSNHMIAKQKINALEHELSVLSSKYESVVRDVSNKDESLLELKNLISTIRDENNNFVEQLEFTKSMLTTKEIENTQLHNQIRYCQNQLDVFQLQIQQLTNNSTAQVDQMSYTSGEKESSFNKMSNLEKTIEALQKERDQINCHYEHYLGDLNKQYKAEVKKNENLAIEIQSLYNRENSLIEQISDMEIRLQNFKIQDNTVHKQENDMEIQKQYQDCQVQLMEMNSKYQELQKQYMDSLAKMEELNKVKDIECNHDNISINKLNADITSDKIAAQRATEQNKKLKLDVENLEQVIIKMGNDKLELTELWTHEKQLNKGLALKLAEVEENVKNILKQLKAKDEEMIRLLNENRDFEKKYESMKESIEKNNQSIQSEDCHYHSTNEDKIPETTSDLTSYKEPKKPITKLDINSDNTIPKQDAMSKLQERFLNIMDQVANLSDEKHRLEHIILQLQTETDTICEYVALYQQQRSLLKKREEERSNQLKIYQTECNKLKRHLEELRGLLLKFASDHEMESFFKDEQRRDDLTRVKELLEELQNCSLINPNFKNLDLNIFYPCSCCSGQIIDI
ncbi:golgin subfamily A member 2 [Pararge aegeria]|uniref:Jg14448 protein n=4 Tax=Pararge aegeria TaxID=116150 RepID=A0A8S4RXA2_9NEOP|nr:golgin subfamily A member 2 [Pararge aegeria]CAH2243156.1 jg14448 [Pararge aegeria aegeria]